MAWFFAFGVDRNSNVLLVSYFFDEYILGQSNIKKHRDGDSRVDLPSAKPAW